MLTAGGMVCCRSASRRIAVVWFLQVTIDRRKLSGHDETVKMEFAKTMTPVRLPAGRQVGPQPY